MHCASCSQVNDCPLLSLSLMLLVGVLRPGLGCAGQRLLEEHLGALLRALLHQAVHACAAATRVTALECLLAAMALPYPLLHPHRGAVLGALGQAVDDPKRAVRTAAVRCRRAWSTM